MKDNLPELGGTHFENSSLPPVYENGGKEERPLTVHGDINERKQKSRRKYTFAWVALLIAALLIGAVGVGVYIFSRNPSLARKHRVEVAEMADTHEPEPKPMINLSSEPYSGLYGASAVEMQMNFTTGEGCRFYRADPHNKFTLRVVSARSCGDGAYEVEIEELIESRIKVGVYRGIISDSEFRGEFVSTHGDRREFHLTR